MTDHFEKVMDIVGITDFVQLYELDFNDFSQIMNHAKGAMISTSIGLITITLKQVLNMVYKKVGRLLKSKKTPIQGNEVVQKFEHVDVDLLFESYFS